MWKAWHLWTLAVLWLLIGSVLMALVRNPPAKASVNDLADIRQELQGIRRALEKGVCK